MTLKTKPLFGILLRGDHPLARGLAGAWLFNEGRGDRLWDLSANGRPGMLTGMDPAAAWVAGPYGYALDFDATDDRVIVGPLTGIDFGTVNACAMRLRVYGLGDRVLVGHKTQFDGGYFLALNALGGLCYAANGAYVSVPHGMTVGDEVWLGVSREGTSVAFYKNGVQLGTTQTLSDNRSLSVSSIGGYRLSPYYAAHMRCDYVYCWDRALSAGEMAWLYRDPFCLFRHRSVLPAVSIGGQVHNLSGSGGAVSSADGTATVIPAAWQPTGTPWPKVSLDIEASWRKEAVLHGVTDVGIKLGTVLTQGWFWARRAGCSAVYRGVDLADAQAGMLVALAPLNAQQIALPMYLPHEPGDTCCYIVRRFNSCGQQYRTTGAAVCIHTDPAGGLAPPAPNRVFMARAEPVAGNRVECTWLYCSLDQQTPPHVFNIYWNGGAGDVDFIHPIAVLPYEGRRYYRYQSEPLQDGRHIFTVRVESATRMESSSQAIAECEIKAVALSEPGVFDVETI